MSDSNSRLTKSESCVKLETHLCLFKTLLQRILSAANMKSSCFGEPFGICISTENTGVLKLELTTENGHKGLTLD